MDVERLRKRIVRRLTSPPEIVYALAQHWVLILVPGVIGVALAIAKIATDPPIHRAEAVLRLADDPAPVSVDPTGRNQSGDLVGNYETRVQLLTSEVVLTEAVLRVSPKSVIRQEANPNIQDYGSVRRSIAEARKWVDDKSREWFEHPTVRDIAQDDLVQQAVASLRRRLGVDRVRGTNNVRISVWGSDPKILDTEIREWIGAYEARIHRISKDTVDSVLTGRKSDWALREEAARLAVVKFKEANPNVTRQSEEFLREELNELRMWRLRAVMQDLRGPAADTPPQPADGDVPNPDRDRLEAKIRLLEDERLDLLVEYEPESVKVKEKDQAILQARRELEAVVVKTRERPQLDPVKLEQDFADAVGKLATMTAKLEELDELTRQLRYCEQMRESYDELDIGRKDREELSKVLQVQVQDPPEVNWRPMNPSPQPRVLQGAFAGLAIGVALALLWEAVGGRVRFRQDIIGEFDVPVVGVVPRK